VYAADGLGIPVEATAVWPDCDAGSWRTGRERPANPRQHAGDPGNPAERAERFFGMSRVTAAKSVACMETIFAASGARANDESPVDAASLGVLEGS
jgi:hypothetical protein